MNTPSIAAKGLTAPHRSMAWPASGIVITTARPEAARASPYSRRPPRSWAMTGMIVTTIRTSTAATDSIRNRPRARRPRGPAKISRHRGMESGPGCTAGG